MLCQASIYHLAFFFPLWEPRRTLAFHWRSLRLAQLHTHTRVLDTSIPDPSASCRHTWAGLGWWTFRSAHQPPLRGHHASPALSHPQAGHQAQLRTESVQQRSAVTSWRDAYCAPQRSWDCLLCNNLTATADQYTTHSVCPDPCHTTSPHTPKNLPEKYVWEFCL